MKLLQQQSLQSQSQSQSQSQQHLQEEQTLPSISSSSSSSSSLTAYNEILNVRLWTSICRTVLMITPHILLQHLASSAKHNNNNNSIDSHNEQEYGNPSLVDADNQRRLMKRLQLLNGIDNNNNNNNNITQEKTHVLQMIRMLYNDTQPYIAKPYPLSYIPNSNLAIEDYKQILFVLRNNLFKFIDERCQQLKHIENHIKELKQHESTMNTTTTTTASSTSTSSSLSSSTSSSISSSCHEQYFPLTLESIDELFNDLLSLQHLIINTLTLCQRFTDQELAWKSYQIMQSISFILHYTLDRLKLHYIDQSIIIPTRPSHVSSSSSSLQSPQSSSTAASSSSSSSSDVSSSSTTTEQSSFTDNTDNITNNNNTDTNTNNTNDKVDNDNDHDTDIEDEYPLRTYEEYKEIWHDHIEKHSRYLLQYARILGRLHDDHSEFLWRLINMTENIKLYDIPLSLHHYFVFQDAISFREYMISTFIIYVYLYIHIHSSTILFVCLYLCVVCVCFI